MDDITKAISGLSSALTTSLDSDSVLFNPQTHAQVVYGS